MTPGGKPVTLVAAVAENGVIGRDGDIPWHLPEDFAHFKRTTVGHVLVLGRTTHEGIGRPLPDRTTVVLTRDPTWRAEGVLVARDFEEAMALADGLDGEVMVGGGQAVYAAALPWADVQLITEVHLSPEGDTYYPEWDRSGWVEAERRPHEGFEVVRWGRRHP